ncbi:MAG: hypothetical protein OEM51_02055 [Gammaproteobacteria bacterium]|nr:hypothetical protein [Gammaproteobacteria bacterium]MDH3430679.1 hypothetical protein [Gammaproteobacteria bacterium]
MPKPVGVALWHLDTRAMPGAHEPTADDKLLALRRRVTTANDYFQQLRVEDDAIKIFAAPEYYFAMGGQDIRGYSADEKETIKRGLRDLSAEYPQIILCAGTVAWKEPLDRSQRAKVAAHLSKAIDRTAGSAGTYRAEVSQAHDRIKLGRSVLKKNTSTRWFGHNTAYIYHSGILVGEINKAIPFFEFSGEEDPVLMIPGFRSGKFNMPMVEGTEPGRKLVLGVEICADAGRLANTFGEKVDVHLLMSATTVPTSPAARHGGLYLHCDSAKPPLVKRAAGMGESAYSARFNPNPKSDPYNTTVEILPIDMDIENVRNDVDLYVSRVELEDRVAGAAMRPD